MKILVLDNYDSFTYNLVHSLQKNSNVKVEVFRNDEITLEQVEQHDKIVLSPGPGIPDEANILKPLIKKYARQKPILGVCLGQQAIAEVFGGKLINTKKVFHGVATEVKILVNNEVLFKGLPKSLSVGRYHSWIVSSDDLPECLEVTAVAERGEVMALRHKQYDVRGVQFHPESILTPKGDEIIKNWLEG